MVEGNHGTIARALRGSVKSGHFAVQLACPLWGGQCDRVSRADPETLSRAAR